MSNFEVGDVVRLKPGSPSMVVTATFSDGLIELKWIAYNTGVPHTMVLYDRCCYKVDGYPVRHSQGY